MKPLRIQPHLTLCIRPAPHRHGGDYHEPDYYDPSNSDRFREPLAILTFIYGGTTIKGFDLRSHYLDNKGNEYERDRQQEAAIIERLEKTGLRPSRRYNLPEDDLALDLTLVNPRRDWLRFVEHELPRLAAEGFDITVDSSFPFKIAQAGTWTVSLNQIERWRYAIKIQFSVDEIEFSLLSLLFDNTHRGQESIQSVIDRLEAHDRIYLQLPDKRYIGMNSDCMRFIYYTLNDLVDHTNYSPENASEICTVAQALALIGAKCMSDVNFCGDACDYLRRSVNAIVSEISTLDDSAEESQRVVGRWLESRRELRLGGILPREIVAGSPEKLCIRHINKTAKSRACMKAPSLVVCTKDKLNEWLRFFADQAPQLSVIELRSGAETPEVLIMRGSDVVLVPYSLLTRRFSDLQQIIWDVLIVDQPDRIECLNGQTVQSIKLLSAQHCLSILDEPWQKHMQKLWLHFDLVLPGVFRTPREFNQLLLTSQESQIRRTLFINLIQPFLVGAQKIFNERPERKLKWTGNKHGRDVNIIMDVLLTNTSMKILAAKYDFKNTGNLQDVARRFTWRMMRRGSPKLEEWRKNRRNRSDADRQELMELLMQTFKATQSDFEGL